MVARYFISKIYKESGRVVGEKNFEGELKEMPNSEKLTAKVYTDRKATINTGNYNSASFTVGVEIPCQPDQDALSEAYSEAAEFCETKLSELIQKVKG